MRRSGNLLEDVLSNLGSAFRDLCSSARNSSESMKIGSIRHEIVTEERYESLHGHPRERRSVSPSFSSGRRRTPCSSNDDSPAENLFATVANLASFCVHTARSLGSGVSNAAANANIRYFAETVKMIKSNGSSSSDEEILESVLKGFEEKYGKGSVLTRQMRQEVLNRTRNVCPGKGGTEEPGFSLPDPFELRSLKFNRRKNK